MKRLHPSASGRLPRGFAEPVVVRFRQIVGWRIARGGEVHWYDALGEQRLHRGAIQRTGQQKALRSMASQIEQCPGRGGSFDALRDDLESERVRHGDDSLHDRQIACVGAEIADE